MRLTAPDCRDETRDGTYDVRSNTNVCCTQRSIVAFMIEANQKASARESNDDGVNAARDNSHLFNANALNSKRSRNPAHAVAVQWEG